MDLANESLPEFETALFPVLSMRLTSPSRKDSGNMDSMEYLIKRMLDEDGDDEGGIIEKLAEILREVGV